MCEPCPRSVFLPSLPVCFGFYGLFAHMMTVRAFGVLVAVTALQTRPPQARQAGHPALTALPAHQYAMLAMAGWLFLPYLGWLLLVGLAKPVLFSLAMAIWLTRSSWVHVWHSTVRFRALSTNRQAPLLPECLQLSASLASGLAIYGCSPSASRACGPAVYGCSPGAAQAYGPAGHGCPPGAAQACGPAAYKSLCVVLGAAYWLAVWVPNPERCRLARCVGAGPQSAPAWPAV